MLNSKKGSVVFPVLMVGGIAVLGSLGYLGFRKSVHKAQEQEAYRLEAQNVVSELGNRMKNVPLAAVGDVLKNAMESNYSGLVSPDLIASWENEPLKAPGRLTSSPWPEKIEIQSSRKISRTTYEVKGEVVEMTSVEMAKGGFFGKYPVTFDLQYQNGKWVVTSFSSGRTSSGGNIKPKPHFVWLNEKPAI